MRPAAVAVVLLAAASAALAGCAGAGRAGGFGPCSGDQWPEWGAGDSRVAVCRDGAAREALLHVPAGAADGGSVPLLLMLHGGGGNAAQFRAASGMDAVAGELGFAVLYAEGTPARRGGDVRTWNAMACCGAAFERGSDDVGFLGALLDGAVERWPVDAARVGVAGHSNGAMMAYRLAAERSDAVTAAVAVAGAIGGQLREEDPVRIIVTPEHPVSILAIHATDDDHVPYEGGHGSAAVDGPRIDLAVADAMAFWRAADGVYSDPVMEERPDGVVAWDQGPGGRGTRVVLLVTEGGHGWPGADGGLRPAPRHPDASREVGEFLLAWPRAAA